MGKAKVITCLLGNYRRFLKISEFDRTFDGDFVYGPAGYGDLKSAKGLYFRLNKRKLTKFHWLLLLMCSRKQLLVVKKRSRCGLECIGINLYYINSRDFEENTIHEGFVGVTSAYEGMGIATKMREKAQTHFAGAGFCGISTRISKSSPASLNSAKKLGFNVEEAYYDAVIREERYYMVRKFRNKSDK